MKNLKQIIIKNANIHNLKNVSLEIPLHKLVVVVGPSGSGKTSLIYDCLYKFSQGYKIECNISKLPNIFAIGQKVVAPKDIKLSLGEYNLQRLDEIISSLEKDELLIVDESCAGLSVEESMGVLKKLKKLITEGKSVIAIEHSKEIIKGADYIIEFGPKSGKYGGEIIFQGDINQFRESNSITADYVFSNKSEIINYKRIPSQKAKAMQKKFVILQKINKNNLKNYTFKFPLGSLVCVFGNSGTGKSTILDVVYSALFKGRNAWRIREKSGADKDIIGKQNVRRTYLVEQTPIGNNPRSTILTYIHLGKDVKKIYPDIQFSKKIKLTIDEAIEIFSDSKLVKRKLEFLQEAGLGYLTLGQRSDSLSGGEAQRVRLAKVLSKKLGDRCIYILDTPTKGLHLSDLPVLVRVLQKIIDKNNTVLVADNKIEIINNSDYAIDMNKKEK